MTWIEALGYIAAVCTLATYSMKTMIPLRISGIAANCFFIAFGFFGAIYPTLILHVVLLPLNAVRLYQMLHLFFQNPKFGFYFMRLATQRLFSDIGRLEQVLEQKTAGARNSELKPAT
jgi:hypothetical protein